MASLIPSEIANIVANAFKGQLVTGTLLRETVSAVDSLGDPTVKTPTTYAIEGIRENFSAYFQTINSIPQTDVRILLIMNLIQPPTTPKQDDYINIYGEWYKVRKVLEIDPARASISLQCFKVSDPTT